jgi:LPXTG-site transpeptidase (sortase) family protein
MRRGPLLAVGLALTVLAVALLTWVMQRGGESAQASAVVPTPSPTTATEAPTSSPTPTASSTPAKPSPSPTKKATSASGTRIKIPAIGLDSAMSARGLSADGTIDPPPGTVMWFKGFERVRPGAVGTAVIAGHVASGDRRDVFANLADVDVGDKVQVLTNGKALSYRVTRASAIDKQKVTTDQAVWGTNTSRSRIAIITCDDAFGFRGDGHRVANFVVIAERA